ncbi:hypothetical protein F4823DRAFT_629926 [Ustulina deusta]|nr:hypothetical protein F4823DRAFT_629926 [Ustulina deusta]
MAQQASSTPSIRDWLSLALPAAPFVYPTKERVPSSNRMYTSLVEDLPVLAHLSAERDRLMRNGLAATKPVVLDAFHVLAIEANLQHFFNLSLIYCLPVVILPHIPFTRVTPRNGSIHALKSYTPNYTVFKDYTNALSCFYISNFELVLIEFVINRSNNITSLNNIIARAESEVSSPMQKIPFRGKPAPNKRRFTHSTTGLAVSPSNHYQHKRSSTIAKAIENNTPAVSLPELPSSIPEQPSPQTPKLKSKHPYSSNAYVLSTPASKGGDVILEQWAPALFGFITLAKLVDERGGKNISARQLSLQDYFI